MRARIITVSLCLSAVVSAAGPKTQGPPRTITLQQALDLARRNAPDARIARARLDQAAAAVTTARAELLPTLTAQAKYTHNNKDVAFPLPVGPPGSPTREIQYQKLNQLDGVAQLTVPVLAPGGIARFIASRRAYQARVADTKEAMVALLFSTAEAYYLAVANDERVDSRRAAVKVADQALSDARTRSEAGRAEPVEVDRARLEQLQQQQALLEAQAERDQAYRALSVLVQLPLPFAVEREATVSAVPKPPADAWATRPEVVGARMRASADRAAATAASLDWLPTVSLFGNARAFNYRGFSGDEYAWSLGVQLDWVLFDGGRRVGAHQLASARAEEAAAVSERTRDQSRDELANATEKVGVRRKGLASAEEGAAIARKSYEVTQARYQAGRVPQIELLRAQETLTASRLALARARFDFNLAVLRLQRAAGSFPMR